MLSCCFIFS
uniref:Uncharacterized protein n=1 Tax=Anguilla anguilla TaxID=7936 RepID=A0A0E9XYV3_ANGAN